MKQFIKEWGFVLLVAILLGGWVGTALADSSFSYSMKGDRGFLVTWTAINGVGNTTVAEETHCNPNGETEHVIASHVVTGTNEMSVWIQDGPTASGPWANAITNSMDLISTNTTTLIQRGSFALGPCFRIHVEDSDVDVTNTVTPTIRSWR